MKKPGLLRRISLRLACTGMCLQLGCSLTGTQFRDVALPGLQTGVTSIVNALLDGVFAVIEPE